MTEPAFVAVAIVALAFAVLYLRARLRARDEARALFDRWTKEELLRLEKELSRSLELRAEALLERHRLEHETRIRRDAVRRSQAVVSGKTTEQLVPFLPDFPFDPKDARFLGSPIDLVVFDGMSADALREIVLVEVKTGPGAGLSRRERQIRDAVAEGRIRFHELRVDRTGAASAGASFFLPLQQNGTGPSGQLEIAASGREVRFWSDWSEPPLVFSLDPGHLVPAGDERHALKLRRDGPLPCLVLERDVRILVDVANETLSVELAEDATLSYRLEPHRLQPSSDAVLLLLDGGR